MSDIELGSLDEVPVGEGRTFTVDGDQIAVFRLRDGSLRAVDAVCPHRGGPLADGLADERVVVCPLHGQTFDLCSGAETGGAAHWLYKPAGELDLAEAQRETHRWLHSLSPRAPGKAPRVTRWWMCWSVGAEW